MELQLGSASLWRVCVKRCRWESTIAKGAGWQSTATNVSIPAGKAIENLINLPILRHTVTHTCTAKSAPSAVGRWAVAVILTRKWKFKKWLKIRRVWVFRLHRSAIVNSLNVCWPSNRNRDWKQHQASQRMITTGCFCTLAKNCEISWSSTVPWSRKWKSWSICQRKFLSSPYWRVLSNTYPLRHWAVPLLSMLWGNERTTAKATNKKRITRNWSTGLYDMAVMSLELINESMSSDRVLASIYGKKLRMAWGYTSISPWRIICCTATKWNKRTHCSQRIIWPISHTFHRIVSKCSAPSSILVT